MKRLIKYSVLLLVAVAVLAQIAYIKSVSRIYVDENTSYFSDFEIEKDKVNVNCHISLANEFREEKKVTLSAFLPEDVKGGLLKEKEMKALDENGAERVFNLRANETTEFDVVFVGDFGGTNQKHDRDLPEIKITIAD